MSYADDHRLWTLVARVKDMACRVAEGKHNAATAAHFALELRDAANYLLVAAETRQVFCPSCGQHKQPYAATCHACRTAQEESERQQRLVQLEWERKQRAASFPPKPNVESVLDELVAAPSCSASNEDETERRHYHGSSYDPSCHVADARRSLRLSDEEKDSDGEPDDVNALLNAPDNQDDDSP
jgi:predicted nucleic acid-binding protein